MSQLAQKILVLEPKQISDPELKKSNYQILKWDISDSLGLSELNRQNHHFSAEESLVSGQFILNSFLVMIVKPFSLLRKRKKGVGPD